MAIIWKGDEIRYWDLAPKLLKSDGEQGLVPFLGAGVSVSDRAENPAAAEPKYPDAATVEQIAGLLHLDGHARLYLEYAIRMAVRMQASEQVNGLPPGLDELRKKLVDSSYPPFAWELAELFSQVSAYNSLSDRAMKAIERNGLLSADQRERAKSMLLPMLKLAAMTTGLGSATDPLTSISSYYESKGERKDVWRRLYEVVATKEIPTRTHRLIAKAAKLQLGVNTAEDYLIVTTNYDWLMEKALDELQVPYAVLWRNHGDGLIYSRFANLPADELTVLKRRNEPRTPGLAILKKTRSLAIVYKMHGCLYKDLKEQDDGLVVTDGDYVEFISQIDNIIPAHVGQLLGARQILFLGYSFSDWNVRSVYERAISRRGRAKDRDYAVTRSLSQFEQVYFENRDLVVIMAELKEFVDGIEKQKV